MELGRRERTRERLVNEKYRKVRKRGKEKGERGKRKEEGEERGCKQTRQKILGKNPKYLKVHASLALRPREMGIWTK